jgi:ketosteroid isomerase-like protein
LKRVRVIVVAALAVALGVWGYRVLFPGDERLIRSLLAAVAETASIKPNQNPLVKLAGGGKLAGFCTPDVVIHIEMSGVRARTIHGQDELREMATAARAQLQEARIQFRDLTVEIAPDRETALVHLTVLANIDGSTDPYFQQFKLRLKKADGRWKISQVDPLRAPSV